MTTRIYYRFAKFTNNIMETNSFMKGDFIMENEEMMNVNEVSDVEV